MQQTCIRRWLLALIVFAPACLCPARHTDPGRADAARGDVVRALEAYVAASRSADPAAVAAFYASSGELLEPGIDPIQGREVIRAFMGSFPGVRVEVATAVPDTVEVFGDKALVWGSYFERLAFPGQPVSEQHGKFVMQWVRSADGRWSIERYYRVPVLTREFGDAAPK